MERSESYNSSGRISCQDDGSRNNEKLDDDGLGFVGFSENEVKTRTNLLANAGLEDEDDEEMEYRFVVKEVENDENDNKIRKSKKQKNFEKEKEKRETKEKYRKAAHEFHQGKYASLKEAARTHNVKYTTLYNGVVNCGGEFRGSGQFTSRLLPEEEMKIVDHVKWRASVGYGLDWNMLRLLIQEVLQNVKLINPDRVTGLEDTDQLPDPSYVRRLAVRHNLAIRATMEISKGRQVVTPHEMKLWQEDAISVFSSKPELMEALQVIFLNIIVLLSLKTCLEFGFVLLN